MKKMGIFKRIWNALTPVWTNGGWISRNRLPITLRIAHEGKMKSYKSTPVNFGYLGGDGDLVLDVYDIVFGDGTELETWSIFEDFPTLERRSVFQYVEEVDSRGEVITRYLRKKPTDRTKKTGREK